MKPFMEQGAERRILSADSMKELREARDLLQESWSGQLLFSITIDQANQMNRLHDVLIRQAVMLSERELIAEGLGSPPSAYAFVLLGSGGRSEQTPWSDQDNGLIYRYERPEPAIEVYFEQLSLKIQQHLDDLGYPPCEGKVVASNSFWRQSLNGWLEKMNHWFADPVWESVRYLLITADIRCIYGDAVLVEACKTHYEDQVRKHPHILRRMLDNTLRHKPLLGMFGQLLREQYGSAAGGIDIKYGAYIPVVNAIRLLAIQAGIQQTNTFQRIEELQRLEIGDSEMLEQWKKAFNVAFRLRYLTGYAMEGGKYVSDGKISSAQLTKSTVRELKESLRTIERLQKWLQKYVNTGGGK